MNDKEDPFVLSPDQERALTLISKGEHVFITGLAGSGKSTMIVEIQKLFQSKRKLFNLTAPTGVAAVNIGGVTIHSFAGVGCGDGSKEDCYKRVLKNPKAIARWQDCSALVIDEISMLSPFLLPSLDFIAKKIRDSDCFFGGIQVIVVGDFYQLPPVIKDKKPDSLEFCFELELWKQNFSTLNSILLRKVHRQKDERFIRLLAEIRQGKLSETGLALLQSRTNVALVGPDSEIKPTKLFPTRAEAFNANKKALAKLPSEVKNFTRKQSVIGFLPMSQRQSVFDKIDKNFPGEVELSLKVGAQVMLLVNLDVAGGLCNGSRGVVTGFEEKTGWPIVKFLTGEPIPLKPHNWEERSPDKKWTAVNTQIPLKLAYGITIHKSQGLSIDLLEIKLEKAWECGQAYVALSRARTLEGLSLLGLYNVDLFQPHPKVLEFYRSTFGEDAV